MARVYGIGTRDITLYPIGGVARLERMPEQPGAEIAIALAGPAVNVAIAGGLYFGLWLANYAFSIRALEFFEPSLYSFVLTLLAINVLLAAFNLLPAFPMDGGRVFRAVMSWFTTRLRATEIAAMVGTVFAVLFGVAALTQSASPMLGFLGLFVWFAGRQELAMIRLREHQRRARQWTGPTVTVEPVMSQPANNAMGFVWDSQRQIWLVVPSGAGSAENTNPGN
jgi:Zn-dependent protease